MINDEEESLGEATQLRTEASLEGCPGEGVDVSDFDMVVEDSVDDSVEDSVGDSVEDLDEEQLLGMKGALLPRRRQRKSSTA